MKAKVTLSIFLLVISLLPLAAATTTAENRVSFKSGDETVQAYLYAPPASFKGPRPALVVIHEWWGLVEWPREQARKLAGRGYVALAIDLYRGKATTDPGEAHELMRALPQDRALRDLRAAVDFLKPQKNVDAQKIGAIGWCMGGGWALTLAEHEPGLAAVVVNYGSLSSDAETLKPIQAPLLGIFGGQDRGITPADVLRFQKQMVALGKKLEIKIYPDAGHGFENPNNKEGFRAADASDAWQRTLRFLAANFKP